jgi:hypothetical protein
LSVCVCLSGFDPSRPIRDHFLFSVFLALFFSSCKD